MSSRVIRDSLRTSEAVDNLRDATFRLYIYLFLAADDFGLIEADYGAIRDVAPMRAWGREDVTKMMAELTEADLLMPYHADGHAYAAINHWRSYVNSTRPKHPVPAFGMGHCHRPLGYKNAATRNAAALILGLLPQASGLPVVHRQAAGGPLVKEQVGVKSEEKRVEQSLSTPDSPPPAALPVASRLPRDWQLPEQWLTWAVRFTADQRHSVTPAAVVALSREFADHWRAKPGKDGAKADWAGAWRTWVRNNFAKLVGSSRPTDDTQARIARGI